MKYRKKPLVVDAIQIIYGRTTPGDVEKALGVNPITNTDTPFIDTLEGRFLISDGDYLIKGTAGEFYPCKPDIFEATYELVE
jgi:hypothetical protein